jgi:protocatechuate 3,4-dioxygenase alpha subunit
MSQGTTPSQTVGPFFDIGFAWMYRADLTCGSQSGEKVTIRGRVLDGEGQSVPDACLEIWQADIRGKYAHPEDPQANIAAREFFGFARVPTNDHGEFTFKTVKPGSIPGPGGKLQAPHLEISVFLRGLLQRLVTRLYFPDDPENATDVVLGLVPAARRETLVARRSESENTLLEWDVRLQGERETVFFDC